MNFGQLLGAYKLPIAFFVIIAGGLFVRLCGLDDYYLSNDDSWHLVVASQKNLWEVIQYNFSYEIHPPLSPIIWHFMLKISQNVLWLRTASLVCGILLIPSVYLFGSLYIGRAAGFVMAMILAFGAMPIAASISIRAYSMMMLALVWVAIFAFQYQARGKNGFLVGYFLSALVAIELHHAAAFVILTFGLLLMAHSLRNKKNFLIISVAHLLLALAVVGYGFALSHIYGFKNDYRYFSPATDPLGSALYYLKNFVVIFTNFSLGTDFAVDDQIADSIKGIFFITLFLSPLIIFRSKNWTLPCLIFAPLLAICLTDYLNLYPFSPTPRNNLFLFLSILSICGFFAQMAWDALLGILVFRIASYLQVAALLVAVFSTVLYIQEKDFFRKAYPNCEEFLLTKTDYSLLTRELTRKNTEKNIFVTVNTNIWSLQFQSGKQGRIEVLTENLAMFKNADLTVYFTSFPEREKGASFRRSDYKIFFKDLFEHLKSGGELDKVKSVTFFEAGQNHSYLSLMFHSQLTEEAEKVLQFADGYEFYFKEPEAVCGREVLLFSLTPQFIENEFFSMHDQN